MATVTPLRYPGGKSKTYSYIKELIQSNNCTTYIEPYAGGAGVAISLLLNNDVDRIMINDFDKSIYAFWYSVLYETENLIDLIEQTEISIDEWYKQKEIQKNKTATNNLLKLGFSTLFLNRTNRSGIIKAGVIGGKEQSGKYRMDCRFNKKDICRRILAIAKYKNKIKLYNLDAEIFVKHTVTHTKNSFTFFDPPYYKQGPNLYTNFYNRDSHVSLANTIKKHMKTKKWILTYDVNDEIYDLYKSFDMTEYYLNYSISTPSKGLEYLFYSPNLQKGYIQNHLQIKK